ncbi:lipase [Loa loa]|uniref:Lipase n=1 Tax=Loa loa TaxID=7209 RepID=A0A1I7VPN9_LOALO|nr:lipase [Loa loa]EFO20186.2 lipase [Loa loa]
MLLYALLLLLSEYYGRGEFTDHFNDFLKRKYGIKIQILLERLDMGLGLWGSFGGKLDENDPISKRPVLFIHGALSRAAVFLKHREYFIYRGYSWSELYATSYGNGLNSVIFDGVHCKYIKQIRQMLLAVNNYTGKTVNIIAYSMGSAVSRKAILGSFCFDTGELLGASLTHLVNTFITVGGTNHGLQICPLIFPLCGSISSLHCNSKLMKELNSQPNRFEGRSSYDIYSLDDSIIGLHCCNESCGVLPNHNASFKVADLDHFTLLSETITLQLSLLKQTDGQNNNNSITRIADINSEDDIEYS